MKGSPLPLLPLNTIIVGDALDRLRALPAESVHCCVTSPPYWGLRNYQVEGQIGLEATPEIFVERLVEIFREVRRVLRSDGIAWVNMGDCYATGAGAVGDCPGGGEQGARWRGDVDRIRDSKRGYRGARLPNGHGDKPRVSGKTMGPMQQPNRMPISGLKPKDLVGIPWRLAFALQADGWWLRSDIIWAKTNPMPESITDRPTKSHEYVFLLAKSERYFYDAAAIQEQADCAGRNIRLGDKSFSKGQARGRGVEVSGSGRSEAYTVVNGRNKRSVWTVATSPYPEAHFATFPQKLIEPCILAGTSEFGSCKTCGAPWRRMTSSGEIVSTRGSKRKQATVRRRQGVTGTFTTGLYGTRVTSGWQASCEHDSASHRGAVVPCVVLDPFMGAGTTGLVAIKARRSFVGIELNPAYAALANKRIGPELAQARLL